MCIAPLWGCVRRVRASGIGKTQPRASRTVSRALGQETIQTICFIFATFVLPQNKASRYNVCMDTLTLTDRDTKTLARGAHALPAISVAGEFHCPVCHLSTGSVEVLSVESCGVLGCTCGYLGDSGTGRPNAADARKEASQRDAALNAAASILPPFAAFVARPAHHHTDTEELAALAAALTAIGWC